MDVLTVKYKFVYTQQVLDHQEKLKLPVCNFIWLMVKLNTFVTIPNCIGESSLLISSSTRTALLDYYKPVTV